MKYLITGIWIIAIILVIIVNQPQIDVQPTEEVITVTEVTTVTRVTEVTTVTTVTEALPTPTPIPTPTPTPIPTPTAMPTPTPRPKVREDNVTELARLLTAEAGFTSTELMLAVGQVVMNRMEEFDMTLTEVIYEKNVFSPVDNKGYKSREISKEARRVARLVLEGSKCDVIEKSLYFVTISHYNKRTGWHWRASHGENPTIQEVYRLEGVIFFSLISN